MTALLQRQYNGEIATVIEGYRNRKYLFLLHMTLRSRRTGLELVDNAALRPLPLTTSIPVAAPETYIRLTFRLGYHAIYYTYIMFSIFECNV